MWSRHRNIPLHLLMFSKAWGYLSPWRLQNWKHPQGHPVQKLAAHPCSLSCFLPIHQGLALLWECKHVVLKFSTFNWGVSAQETCGLPKWECQSSMFIRSSLNIFFWERANNKTNKNTQPNPKATAKIFKQKHTNETTALHAEPVRAHSASKGRSEYLPWRMSSALSAPVLEASGCKRRCGGGWSVRCGK